MRETRTKLFTDSFNMTNTQSSIKSSSKWSFYTVQIGNFNRKSAWKSITDQTVFEVIEKGLLFGSLRRCLSMAARMEVSVALFSRGDIKLQFFFFYFLDFGEKFVLSGKPIYKNTRIETNCSRED